MWRGRSGEGRVTRRSTPPASSGPRSWPPTTPPPHEGSSWHKGSCPAESLCPLTQRSPPGCGTSQRPPSAPSTSSNSLLTTPQVLYFNITSHHAPHCSHCGCWRGGSRCLTSSRLGFRRESFRTTLPGSPMRPI